MDYAWIKAGFNNNKSNRKPTYTWKLGSALLNDTLVKEKNKEIN
jgi:hypothetical protein